MPLIDIKKNKLIPIFSEFSPLRIKYKDIFDSKAFMDALKEWLWDHGWTSMDGKKEQWETFYGERVSQGGAKEIWVEWRCAQNAPGIGNIGKEPMMRYYLDFSFHFLGLSSTEVVRDGKKIKVDKGEVEMLISAFIDPIALKKVDSHSLLKSFAQMFRKRIYAGEITNRQKELYQITYELGNFIKQWFKLKRYLPYEETSSFYPSAAYPKHLG